MYKNIRNFLTWSFYLGANLAQIVPGYTFLVVLGMLISQLSVLLAFFLPLKVIILLGSPDIPQYFPTSWRAFDRDYLVVAFSLAAIVFYLLHLFAERMISSFSELGAATILDKNNKMVLFENQEVISVGAYQRYVRSLAGIVFIGFSLIILWVIYPAVLLAIIVCSLSILVMLFLGYGYNQSIKNKINTDSNRLGAASGSICFLLTFIFIVVDFLEAPAPSIIVAIVSLLLIRQLMSRLTGIIIDLKTLYIQKAQVNALFLLGDLVVPDPTQKEKDFWLLLGSPSKEKWICEILKEVVGCHPAQLECRWNQIGFTDVVAFEVLAKDKVGKHLGSFLVKLFNNNRKSIGRHEASLLMDGGPALQFLGAGMVGKYHCNIFKWDGGTKIIPQQLKLKRLELFSRLIALEPDKQLIEQYARSHPMLPQRLSDNMLERLHLVAGDSKLQEYVERLKLCIVDLKIRLEALPIQILNPEIKPENLHVTEDGELVAIHWGRWIMEPIGAGWPVREKELDLLEDALNTAKISRSTLAYISVRDLRLSALTFSFEQLYNRQKYISALELLPSVLSCIESCDAGLRAE